MLAFANITGHFLHIFIFLYYFSPSLGIPGNQLFGIQPAKSIKGSNLPWTKILCSSTFLTFLCVNRDNLQKDVRFGLPVHASGPTFVQFFFAVAEICVKKISFNKPPLHFLCLHCTNLRLQATLVYGIQA